MRGLVTLDLGGNRVSAEERAALRKQFGKGFGRF